jgi:hypothetical protein
LAGEASGEADGLRESTMGRRVPSGDGSGEWDIPEEPSDEPMELTAESPSLSLPPPDPPSPTPPPPRTGLCIERWLVAVV